MVVNKKQLTDILSNFGNVIKNDTLSILRNIKLISDGQTLKVLGTNGFVILEMTMPVSGEPMEIILPFAELNNIIKTHKSQITFRVEDKSIILNSGSVVNKLVLSPTFSNLRVNIPLDTITLPDDFISGIRELLITVDDSHKFNSVLFSKGELVGLNTTILTVVKSTLSFDDLQVKKATLMLLMKLAKGKVKMGIDDKRVYFFNESFVLIANYVKGGFPDYKSVIPEFPTTMVTVNGEELLDAINNCMVYTERLHFEVAGSKLVVSGKGEIGEARLVLDGTIEGTPTTIKVVADVKKYIQKGKPFYFETVTAGNKKYIAVMRDGVAHYIPQRLR